MCAGGCRALPRSRFRNRSSTELRNPRRGGLAEGKTKVLAGWFAGEFCPALRSRRPFRFGDGIPARPCRARHGHFVRGGGRRAEPGLRTSRQEKPAATAAKNRPRRGRPGIKKVCQGSALPVLGNCKDFRLCKNAHPGLWGNESSTNLHRNRKKNVLRT